MRGAVAMVLAGGRGEALTILTKHRPSSALPFGGRYRIIDFALSNCVNSEIFRIGVLTQYSPVSLRDHIGIGQPWDLDRRDGGVKLLQPFVRSDRSNWYRGTADAIRQNLHVIDRSDVKTVLIVSGDSVYKMDYSEILSFHQKRGAKVTLVVTPVSREKSDRFGMVDLNADSLATSFEEKPLNKREGLAFTGIYVYDAKLLTKEVTSNPGLFDLVRNFVVPMIEKGEPVLGYVFRDYWEDMGEISAYYDANMALLSKNSRFNLYDPDWIIYTKSEERPPAKLGAGAEVSASLVANGCEIEGTVLNSILFPGVVVGRNALVKDSILMHGTVVSRNARIEKAILDKRVRVGDAAVVSPEGDLSPNSRFPAYLSSGISILGKGTVVPGGFRILGNSIVEGDLGRLLPSKESEICSGSCLIEEKK
ncbi:MAG: glucose-1-phosphate adenylyltransferase subunit GlgD [Candidatus Eisenbacteria bacterium]|nr:glucose-1-phosphate adenylyltransferase subunit GlgD [Candidatus Eisenbacteria bacterium]